MAENQTASEIRKMFADYLRETLVPPSDWYVGTCGSFPPTVHYLQIYFEQILRENSNSLKIKAINNFYELNEIHSLEKKIEKIDGLPRSIQNFFVKKTAPNEDRLNFIALIFESPISTLREFETLREHKQQAAEVAVEAEVTSSFTETEPVFVKEENFQNAEYQINNDISSPPETNIIFFKPKRKFFLNTRKRRIVIFISIALVIIAFVAVKANYASLANASLVNAAAESGFMPIYVGDSLFVGSTVSLNVLENDEQINEIQTHSPLDSAQIVENLQYATVSIYNNQYLYSLRLWNFEVDKNGEDMNSKWGAPYNTDIVELYPTLKNTITLSNNEMELTFNISNRNNLSLFFHSIKLKILERIPITPEHTSYNIYSFCNTLSNFRLAVELSNHNLYGIVTNHTEIASNKAQFCKLRVHNSSENENTICKFRISVDLVDAAGNHYIVESNKDYFIASYCN